MVKMVKIERFKDVGGKSQLALAGSFESHGAALALEREIDSLVGDGEINIELDVSKLISINHYGFATMLSFYDRYKQQGIELMFSEPTPGAGRVMYEMLKLNIENGTMEH